MTKEDLKTLIVKHEESGHNHLENLEDYLWPHIAMAIETVRKPVDITDLYQFEAGQKDGKITGWNTALEKASEIVSNVIVCPDKDSIGTKNAIQMKLEDAKR